MREELSNTQQNSGGIALTECGNKPLFSREIVLGIVASLCAMTQRNHVAWDRAGAIRMAQGYPMISCQGMKQSSGTTAHGTAAIEILKGKLPVGGREVVGAIRLASKTDMGTNKVGFAIALIVFALTVWVGIAPSPRPFNALGAIEFSGFAEFLVARPVSLANQFAILLAVCLILLGYAVAIRFFVDAHLRAVLLTPKNLLLVIANLARWLEATLLSPITRVELRGKRLHFLADGATLEGCIVGFVHTCIVQRISQQKHDSWLSLSAVGG